MMTQSRKNQSPKNAVAGHIQILKDELEKRKRSNPRYSLRAFARFLAMDASALSRILSNKQDLSLSVCLKILDKLKFSEQKRMQFMASVTEEKRNKASLFFSKSGALLGGSAAEVEATKLSNCVLFSRSPDEIYVIDSEGRYLYVNEAGAQTSGLPPSEIIGRTLKQLELESDLTREIREKDSVVFLSGKPLRYEFSSESEGRLIWRERLVTPFFDEGGKVSAVVVDVRDITERKQLELRLRFLSDAGKFLASSLDIEQTLANVARAAIEGLCDFSLIHRIDEAAPLGFRLVQARHRACEHESILSQMRELVTKNQVAQCGVFTTLFSAQTHFLPNVADYIRKDLPLSQEFLQLHLMLSMKSCICIPILTREKVFGSIILGRDASSREFTQEDFLLSVDFVNRAAIAIENASLFHSSQALSRELQAQTKLFQAVLSGTAVQARIQAVRESGEMVPLDVNASPLRDDAGKIFAGVAFFHRPNDPADEEQ